ncbi:sensor histidine kinase [Bacillus carboniphilus]|uniref:Signal transduction histidine-protein kinase/phosphatase DegS n=1 Tax=Bacillus carboniphilus TaxID=86663 RepID=A0ABY9JQ26_9BACI|nr:sensor histidine kinase [Bacillus carboniphilus]WLR41497.1 sensor histidine kinase [Bacillus carboniphilus]
MSIQKLDAKLLDKILEKMVKTVHTSKDEIFEIGENSRRQYDDLLQELSNIKIQVNDIIEQGDQLGAHSRLARQRLSEVSKNFQKYSEPEVHEAYEKAHKLQVDVAMLHQQEKQLRDRRDELERRLVNLKGIIERADSLVGQISVVINYLNQDLRQVGEIIEDAKQKQEFGLRIIEAQEEERKRLSREIHDGPAQMLANVLMRSELIDRISRQQGPEHALEEVRSLRVMVRDALYEVRRIIYDLRPMALDDLGLIPTLRKYLSTIEDYNGKTSIEFSYRGEEDDDHRLPAQFEVALFRLVQEAVTNSLKHAAATKIHVRVEVKDDLVNLVVKDNGKGFDQSKVNNRNKKSFGLLGMKERVELLEGKMTIDSRPNIGTFIIIQVPLNI